MRYCIFLILTFMCLHLQGQNIKGTVTDNKGIPVPDVAVSDGINIVKTNANGQYAMQSDKHRGTIFVISPSGYTVPLKKEGLQADFWRHFKLPADKTEEINFTLIPQDQSCYNVMFTTDIHLNNFPPQDDLRRFHEFVMPVVKEIATENAKEGIPMYTFHLGDMSTDAHWYEQDFNLDSAYYKLIAEGFPGPLYNITGNHDNDPNIIGKNVDFRAEWRYRKLFGPTYYSMNIGSDHWIMMDDIIYVNTPFRKKRRPAGTDKPRVRGKRDFVIGFTQDEMNWLKKDLEAMPDGMTVRFCTHTSLLFEYPEGKGTQLKSNAQLDSLITLLSRYDGKVHAYTGHTHRLQFARNDIFPQIEDLMLPAVSGNVWGTGHQQMIGIDASNAGVIIGHFAGKTATYDYKTFLYGKKPMRLYDMNSVMNYYRTDSVTLARLDTIKVRTDYRRCYDNMLYANIWEWRPDDIVKMYENGRELEVKKVNQGDPLIFVGIVLNVNTLIKPQYLTCHHLFAAQAHTAQSPVTIKVFDRNGKLRFEEQMQRPKPFSLDME